MPIVMPERMIFLFFKAFAAFGTKGAEKNRRYGHEPL